jgi:osmoprotectant transport system ATP-binding protein
MIKLDEVTKIYPGSTKKVVDNLSLHIKQGEICVLVGASGCGKTTTMRMINRLIDVTSGKIYVDGKDINTINPIDLRLNIGYVIQDIGLFPHYTIEKNIATVPIEKKWKKERIAARVKEMMELVELDADTYANKKPSALSGGQKQRVGVARALAADPPIMLMDEPFGALDPITRTNLQNEFLNIQERIKKTIVFVTHDIDEAIKLGDKIAVMQNGKLSQFGTPHEILTRPENEFVENLVGSNRIIKCLSLIKCGSIKKSAPMFRLQSQRDEIINYISKLQRLSSHPNIGILDEDDRPLGYIPIFKYEKDDTTPIEDRIITCRRVVYGDNSLYDVLGALFATGDRGIFCTGEDGKASSFITMTNLFEAVDTDERKE